MPATMTHTEQITINDKTVHEARQTHIPDGATLTLRTPDGTELPLPPDIQRTLLGALAAIADHGEVTIGRMPEELSSTVAADLLGVSRPTLMRWAKEGSIESFKVRTHTRFRRREVLRVRAERIAERRAALDDLRAFETKHDHLFDD